MVLILPPRPPKPNDPPPSHTPAARSSTDEASNGEPVSSQSSSKPAQEQPLSKGASTASVKKKSSLYPNGGLDSRNSKLYRPKQTQASETVVARVELSNTSQHASLAANTAYPGNSSSNPQVSPSLNNNLFGQRPVSQGLPSHTNNGSQSGPLCSDSAASRSPMVQQNSTYGYSPIPRSSNLNVVQPASLRLGKSTLQGANVQQNSTYGRSSTPGSSRFPDYLYAQFNEYASPDVYQQPSATVDTQTSQSTPGQSHNVIDDFFFNNNDYNNIFGDTNIQNSNGGVPPYTHMRNISDPSSQCQPMQDYRNIINRLSSNHNVYGTEAAQSSAVAMPSYGQIRNGSNPGFQYQPVPNRNMTDNTFIHNNAFGETSISPQDAQRPVPRFGHMRNISDPGRQYQRTQKRNVTDSPSMQSEIYANMTPQASNSGMSPSEQVSSNFNLSSNYQRARNSDVTNSSLLQNVASANTTAHFSNGGMAPYGHIGSISQHHNVTNSPSIQSNTFTNTALHNNSGSVPSYSHIRNNSNPSSQYQPAQLRSYQNTTFPSPSSLPPTISKPKRKLENISRPDSAKKPKTASAEVDAPLMPEGLGFTPNLGHSYTYSQRHVPAKSSFTPGVTPNGTPRVNNRLPISYSSQPPNNRTYMAQQAALKANTAHEANLHSHIPPAPERAETPSQIFGLTRQRSNSRMPQSRDSPAPQYSIIKVPDSNAGITVESNSSIDSDLVGTWPSTNPPPRPYRPSPSHDPSTRNADNQAIKPDNEFNITFGSSSYIDPKLVNSTPTSNSPPPITAAPDRRARKRRRGTDSPPPLPKLSPPQKTRPIAKPKAVLGPPLKETLTVTQSHQAYVQPTKPLSPPPPPPPPPPPTQPLTSQRRPSQNVHTQPVCTTSTKAVAAPKPKDYGPPPPGYEPTKLCGAPPLHRYPKTILQEAQEAAAVNAMPPEVFPCEFSYFSVLMAERSVSRFAKR